MVGGGGGGRQGQDQGGAQEDQEVGQKTPQVDSSHQVVDSKQSTQAVFP